MKTSTLLALSALFAAGCSASHVAPTTAAQVDKKAHDTADFTDLDQTLQTSDEEPAKVAADARKPGDFVVFDFDGSYRGAPLELTERVMSRADDAITLQLTFAEKGKPTETLRVTSSLALGHTGDITHVQKKNAAGAFEDATTETYDRLIGMTVASTDVNDEELSHGADTLHVGDANLAVTKTTYRVQIGKTAATMETLSSDGFAWGDVGGEIHTDGGGVFYRAKLVGMGSDPASVASIR